MFELKQKVLAAFLDLVRMAHRIGVHSVSDLHVRRAQFPLGPLLSKQGLSARTTIEKQVNRKVPILCGYIN